MTKNNSTTPLHKTWAERIIPPLCFQQLCCLSLDAVFQESVWPPLKNLGIIELSRSSSGEGLKTKGVHFNRPLVFLVQGRVTHPQTKKPSQTPNRSGRAILMNNKEILVYFRFSFQKYIYTVQRPNPKSGPVLQLLVYGLAIACPEFPDAYAIFCVTTSRRLLFVKNTLSDSITWSERVLSILYITGIIYLSIDRSCNIVTQISLPCNSTDDSSNNSSV